MIERLSGETRLFPIIGDPIIYAKSPQRLTSGFAARGQNCICVPMQVPEGDLDRVMHGLSKVPNIDGLLVTMPHKFAASTYCATSSERTKLLKVVSVMRRNADGSWHGDMLDGLAFVKAQIRRGRPPGRGAGASCRGGRGGKRHSDHAARIQGPRTHRPRRKQSSRRRTGGAFGGARQRWPGFCRPAGPDRLRHGVQRNSNGHGRRGCAARCRGFARPFHVRGRRDRWTWSDAIVAGRARRRLQDGQRRSDGRGRAGDDARFHARKVSGRTRGVRDRIEFTARARANI